jgi:gp16 family phage-associated protein
MSSRIAPSDLEHARQRFYLRGQSVAEWSRAHGFDERQVYSVLSGRSKALRGRAHLIAVELGLKPRLADEPVQPNSSVEARAAK